MDYEHLLHATAWQFAKDSGLNFEQVEEIKNRLRPMYEAQAKVDFAFRWKVYNLMRMIMNEFQEILED